MSQMKTEETKQIEGMKDAPFNFLLSVPFVKKNWYGKSIETIESLNWDYCSIGVVKEIVNVIKDLPIPNEDDPQAVMTLTLEHSDKLAYVIAKAYEGAADIEPDQSLINHIESNTPMDQLMKGFYLVYQSLGLEYLIAAMQMVHSTASILKADEDV